MFSLACKKNAGLCDCLTHHVIKIIVVNLVELRYEV